jgi:hypothetical protein
MTGWIFHFPFRPELVCRVVPHDAIFVSRHISPAVRLNALADSNAAAKIINQLGVVGKDIEETLADPGIRKLVDIIGAKYIVSGFVPGVNHNEGDFVFGAWIGGWTQPLRWGWFDHWMTDFYVHKLADGQRIWVMPFSETGDDYYLSLVVNEGVLAGTISKDKFKVLHILPRLANQYPVISMADEWCNEPQKDRCDDEFIASLMIPYGKNEYGHIYLRGQFNEVSADKISMRTAIDADRGLNNFLQKTFYKMPDGNIGDAGITGIIGDAPGILVAMPVTIFSTVIDLYGGSSYLPEWGKLKSLLKTTGPLYLFVAGDKYYGRIMHMKVPAFGFALPLRDGIKADTAVNRIIDEFNASRKWGLLATADSHNRGVRIINSVRSGDLNKLGKNEKPAFAVQDGYLIGLSNVDVLRRILAQGNNTTGVESEWAKLAGQHESSLYGWSDLNQTGDVAMKALIGYTLVSLITGNQHSVRYDTDELKTVIKALGALKHCSVWFTPKRDQPILNAEIVF